MKVAVCSSSSGNNSLLLEKAKNIGKEIAKLKHTLVVGGCKGYPYAAERGTLLENGKVIVYSPGKDEEEHKKIYDFPIDTGVKYIFTGNGLPGRNLDIIKNSDVIIFIDGQIGTLNEFTLAFILNKKILVLKNSGGISDEIPRLNEICGKKDINYFENENDLTKTLANL